MRVWHTIASLLADHGRCAMVTVVEVKGSAPREEGARLLVVEGGNYRGTIGGGALEWRALAEAQEALSRQAAAKIVAGGARPRSRPVLRRSGETFDRNAGQRSTCRWSASWRRGKERARSPCRPCLAEARFIAASRSRPGPGPAVRLVARDALIEQFGEDNRAVYLFGAGHVGRALVLALAPLPFAVTWIDSRSEAFPGAVPANVAVVHAGDPAAAAAQAPTGAFVVVMTHSHAMDLAITARALAISHIPYVGVIGSDTKRARFLSRLRAAGFQAGELDRFVCPIGLTGIRSKLPAIIAASIAADLVARDERLHAATSLTVVQRTA